MSAVKILLFSATLDIIIIFLSLFSPLFLCQTKLKQDRWLAFESHWAAFRFFTSNASFPRKKVATPFVFFKLQAFFFGILRENECSNVSFPSLREIRCERIKEKEEEEGHLNSGFSFSGVFWRKKKEEGLHWMTYKKRREAINILHPPKKKAKKSFFFRFDKGFFFWEFHERPIRTGKEERESLPGIKMPILIELGGIIYSHKP